MGDEDKAGKSAPPSPDRNAIVAWVIKNRDPLLIGLIIAFIGIVLGAAVKFVPDLGGHSGGSSSVKTGGATDEEGAEETAVAQTAGVVEFADNRSGSPVFSSPMTAPVAGEPTKIPYGTEVVVSCFAKNESGIPSISGFYLIADGTWQGDYVVTDTMTNGGEVGDEDSPNVDEEVPPCSP